MKRDRKVQEMMDFFGDWFLEDGVLERGRMTKELYPYDTLFSPIQINRLTVKNRVVMGPMGNISMCEETGRPNEKMLAYFVERAKGGAGLITTGLIPVSHGIDPSITEPGETSYFPRIDRTRTVFAGWRDLSSRVHSYGARIFIQLSAGLGRVGNPQCLMNAYKLPVSASCNPNFYMGQVPCLPLTGFQLNRLVKNIGQAAIDGKVMGLDGVYLHGHEGYLLEQMTNPAFNRRRFGRYADWQAFGLDTVREIRRRVGPDYPIMYRIDLSLALNETYGARMNTPSLKRFQNGRTVAETLDYMKNLVRAGVDLFDVDLGSYDNWWLCHPPGSMPPACYTNLSALCKAYFKKEGVRTNAGQEVVLVGVGKLGYPDLAERELRAGKCDMVMLARPLLADPQWPNKARAGKVEQIIPCIGCQEGCINEFVEGGHPQCAVNPRTGFEDIYPALPPKAETPCKIAVVGAGPAGVMCAVTAARRGHTVDLFEKSGRIGGRLNPGSVPKIKFDVANYLVYLNRLLARSEAELALHVHLNTEATADSLKKRQYDKIVVAAGTYDTQLKLPGYEDAPIVQAVELLDHPERAADAKKVVVCGAGVVGCETAYFLNKEMKKDVTVIEMTEFIMNHTCTANRGWLIKYMYDANIRLMNCTRAVAFTPEGVRVMHNISKTVPDPYLTWHPILPEAIVNPLAKPVKAEEREELLPADLIVLAAGGRPDDGLFYQLQVQLTGTFVYNVGDSFAGGKVFEANKAGYALGLAL